MLVKHSEEPVSPLTNIGWNKEHENNNKIILRLQVDRIRNNEIKVIYGRKRQNRSEK